MGIKFEDTVGAIERLEANGTKATLNNIRAELGTGSKSTIVKHRRKWRDEMPSISLDSKQKIELPRPIISAIDKVLKEKYDQLKAEYDNRIETSEDDISGFAKDLSDIEKKYQEQKELSKAQESQLIAEKLRSSDLLNEINKLNSKLDKNSQLSVSAEIEIVKLNARLEKSEKLEKENNELRKELKNQVARAVESEKNEAAAIARLDSKVELVESIQHALTSAEKRLEQASGTLPH